MIQDSSFNTGKEIVTSLEAEAVTLTQSETLAFMNVMMGGSPADITISDMINHPDINEKDSVSITLNMETPASFLLRASAVSSAEGVETKGWYGCFAQSENGAAIYLWLALFGDVLHVEMINAGNYLVTPAPFSTERQYSMPERVTYNGAQYVCLVFETTLGSFVASEWAATASLESTIDLTASLASLAAMLQIAPAYDATKTYLKGDIVTQRMILSNGIFTGVIYEAKQDIASPEAWTSGHWEQKLLSDVLSSRFAAKEDVSNKTTSLSGSSTDTQYPSAKATYDADLIAKYHLGAFDSVDTSNANYDLITRKTGYLYAAKGDFDSLSYWGGSTGNDAYGITLPEAAVYDADTVNYISNLFACVSYNNRNADTSFKRIYLGSSTEIALRGNWAGVNEVLQEIKAANLVVQYELNISYTEKVIKNQPLNTLDQQGSEFVRDEWEKTQNLCPNSSSVSFIGDHTPIGVTLKQGTYTIDIPNTPVALTVVIKHTDNTKSYYDIVNGTSVTFNALENDIIESIYSSQPFTSNIMLNEGDHAYPYQPYYGKILRPTDLKTVGGNSLVGSGNVVYPTFEHLDLINYTTADENNPPLRIVDADRYAYGCKLTSGKLIFYQVPELNVQASSLEITDSGVKKTFTVSYDHTRDYTANYYWPENKSGTIALLSDCANMIETTMQELSTNIGSSALNPGMFYRITDYAPTWSGNSFVMAGNQFDIIVLALTSNKLAGECWFTQHVGDTYFANSDLSKWKGVYKSETIMGAGSMSGNYNGYRTISGDPTWDFSQNKTIGGTTYYCFTSFNASAGTSPVVLTRYVTSSFNAVYQYNGVTMTQDTGFTNISGTLPSVKAYGYIDRLIDEFDNDLPYDFKNVKLLDTVNGSSVYVYTFSNEGGSLDDSILNGNNVSSGNPCRGNKIIWKSDIQTLPMIRFRGANNNNVFGKSCYNFLFGKESSDNVFGENCHDNTFGYQSSDNVFGANSYNNTFGSLTKGNRIGKGFTSNSCDSDFCCNQIGNACSSNTFGLGFTRNVAPGELSDNQFGSSAVDNYFGSCFRHNILGSACQGNSFGCFCEYFECGSGLRHNVFGDACSSIRIGDSSSVLNNFAYNTIDGGCENLYIGIGSGATASSDTDIQNIHIHSGVCGASSSNRRTISVPDRNLAYSIDYYAPNSRSITLDA